MPELPDVTIYVEALEERIIGKALTGVRLISPFLLRTAEPPLAEAFGRKIVGIQRLGKRIVLGLDNDLFLVIHLMIAGRLQWKDSAGAKLAGRISLAAFDFADGTLIFTEASSKKRASLHVVSGEAGLADFDRGGIEPLTCKAKDFAEALRAENRTLKRALTDPTIVSGIGNSYSDEILHHAKLSPVTLTSRLDDEAMDRLFKSTRTVLTNWTKKLRKECDGAWPTKVTAFRDGMAVHGRFGQPCPVCGTAVQRISYAENEANYCPTCQTDGKLLADRSLSKLFRGEWPKTLAELEDRKRRLQADEPPAASRAKTKPVRRSTGTKRQG